MQDVPAMPGVTETALQAYLLGTVDLEDILRAQRRLVYEVAGSRQTGALVLCEHDPVVSVGREGSREHVRVSPAELLARRWPVRWVNRGGGCVFHLPGQLAVYSVLAIDRLGLGLQAYLDQLHAALIDVLAEFEVPASMSPGQAGVWVHGRRVAHVGIAVNDWVAYFGAALNVNPDMDLLRRVSEGGDPSTVTSMERERRSPVRPAAVRHRLVEAFRTEFGFDRLSVFHDLPEVGRNVRLFTPHSKSA